MTDDLIFGGLLRKRGEFAFLSHGLPVSSLSLNTPDVSCSAGLFWPFTPLNIRDARAIKRRCLNTVRYLYGFSDLNMVSQNYKFFRAFLIISSTVRFFSSLVILS